MAAHKEDAAETARLLAEAEPEDESPCPPHCCCCGPGDICCDCGEVMPIDYGSGE